jgi:3-phytase
MRMRLGLPLLLLIALGAGCHPGEVPGDVRIPEAWRSAPDRGDNLDSLAIWQSPGGQRWVIGTGKATDRLTVHDLETGSLIRHAGGPGSGRGQFSRPNGIAVTGDLLFVVERDNHRIQVFRLPGLEPLGWFGESELRKPYGLTILEKGNGRLEMWVTDDFEAAPGPELGQRLRRYLVETSGQQVTARALGAAGATEGPGALLKVESIQADPEQKLLLVADETGRSLDVYDLEGRFTGRQVQGLFDADPEGIVLYHCPDGGGYWVTTEQRDARTRFHVLDRKTLEPVGVFVGNETGNTDGIALTQEGSPRFPQGALLAVHDDRAVAAFDWADIAAGLKLRACPEGPLP